MPDETCGICGHSKVATYYVDAPRENETRGVRVLAFFCLQCDFNDDPPRRRDNR